MSYSPARQVFSEAYAAISSLTNLTYASRSSALAMAMAMAMEVV